MLLKTLTKIVMFVLIGFSGFSQTFELVENKGQWNKNVKFQARLLTGAFYLEPHGYKVLKHDVEDMKKVETFFHGTGLAELSQRVSIHLRSHAYEVSFNNCNENPEIIAEEPHAGYNNYFIGNDQKGWASDCKIYGSATYKNMYPGIDVRYYSYNGQLKYDIIVSPGADINKLGLTYDGIEKMELREGKLIVSTSVGEIKEEAPISYQYVNGVRKEVFCKFHVSGKTLSYQIGNYDHTKTLIIDPTLVFSSFTGSTADNWGYVATYGPNGTSFAAGIVFGNGFPVSNGAFQTTFGGGTNTGEDAIGFDIGIIKLSSDGSQRIYATYIGGAGNESPQSIIADGQGNLIVAGRSTSFNFPVTRPLIGTGGNWDIITFKLNAAGTALIGSIRIGGTSDDGVNIRNKYPNPQPTSLAQNYNDDTRCEVIFDNTGNILLVTCTQSVDFPIISATAFQPIKSGKQDALLLKFDGNLTNQLYGSFLGGNEDDAAYTIAISPITGNTWIGGGTASTNFPGNKTGTLGPNQGGNIDGFIAEISTAGALLKSTYIATTANEQVYGLKFDKNGFPYIMGTTTGNFPIQNAPFSQTGGKQFICKLQKDLSSYVYSTVFGSGAAVQNISPTAFFVDNCENVYATGWGGSITSPSSPQYPNAGTNGLTVTPNAIQSTTDGKDFYLFVLEKNATSQLYGSFFGQNGGTTDHVDGAVSRFDEDGTLYMAVCANCGGNANFPTTPGSWAPVNSSGGGCNQALVKIKFGFGGVTAGIKSSISFKDGETSSCIVPFTVDFRDTIAVATTYEWDFGDGTGSYSTLTPNLSHTYNSTGNFRVRLIAIDNNTCNVRDTSFVNIISSSYPNIGSDTTVYHDCLNETSNLLQLYNTTGLNTTWNTNNPAIASPGFYQVVAANPAGCADTAFVIIKLEVARWNGTESSDWHNPANWDINKIPGSKTHVIVNSGTPFPCIISAADAEAASIQVRNGATVETINNTMVNIRGVCLTLPN